MTKRRARMVLSLLLALVLVISGMAGIGPDSADTVQASGRYAIPELLITEIVMKGFYDNANDKTGSGYGSSSEIYEAVEIYNTSDHNINLKDYRLVLWKNTGGTSRTSLDIVEDSFIQPGQTVVVWPISTPVGIAFKLSDQNTTPTVADLRRAGADNPLYDNFDQIMERYRTKVDVTAGAPVYFGEMLGIVEGDLDSNATFNLLPNKLGKLAIRKDTAPAGDYICYAEWDDASEDSAGKSHVYNYPIDGTIKMRLFSANTTRSVGRSYPTPSVSHTQVVNTLEEAAAIPITAAVTKLTGAAVDSRMLTGTIETKLYYETKNTSGYKSVEMTGSDTTYSAAIPAEDVSGSAYVNYYIEVKDDIVAITSPADKKSPYTVTIPASDSALSDIKINGESIVGFSASNTSYKVSFDEAVIPDIEAITRTPGATVAITPPTAIPGTGLVIVTSKDRKSTQTYTITFDLGLPDDATLKDLRVNDNTVSGFARNVYTYNVVLPYGTTAVPTVTARTTVKDALYSVYSAVYLPGTTRVEVTSADQTVIKNYVLNFSVGLNGNATLSDLKVDETTVAGFQSTTYEYNVELPYGTTTVPTVTATASVPAAVYAQVYNAASLPGTTRIRVVAQDQTICEYKVNFTIGLDKTDATLRSIELSEGALDPMFRPDRPDYTAIVLNRARIGIAPTAHSIIAKGITINGNPVDSGKEYISDLQPGQNGFEIVVKAGDDQTTRTYKVLISNVSGSASPSGGGSSGGVSGGPVSGGTTSAATATPDTTAPSAEAKPVVTVPEPILDAQTGEAKVTIKTQAIADAFDKAAADRAGNKTVSIEIPRVDGAAAYVTVLPVSILAASDVARKVEIKTEVANVVVPSNMLANAGVASQEVSLTIANADISDQPEEVKKQIGGRPVIDLSVTVDGKRISYDNPEAPVTVSLPYRPTAEELEKPENIVVWYIDDSGKAIPIPNCRYDTATGMATFTTTHFSQYAIVFVEKNFEDLAGYAWAKEAIEAMAARGSINGTSEKTFTPDANIKRADFIMLLVKALGLSARVNGNFSDVAKNAYYAEAVGIAKALGIVKGSGDNQFNPHEEISRQDMMVMTAGAMRMVNKLSAVGTSSDLKFSDESDIAAYATADMAALAKEGLVKGNANRINPLGSTTRAEAAVLIYRVFNKVSVIGAEPAKPTDGQEDQAAKNSRGINASAGIIVDDTDSGFTTDSPWTVSSVSKGFYGEGYVHDGSSAADGKGRWAKWTPDIPAEGNYRIYIKWVHNANRAGAAPLEIKYKDGVDTSKTLNQKEKCDDWYYLGTYNLSAGKDNYVKILAADKGYTIADAVMFVQE